VDVKLGGAAIIGSPFFVKSFDKTKVRVFGLLDGVVNKTTTFTGLSLQSSHGMVQSSSCSLAVDDAWVFSFADKKRRNQMKSESGTPRQIIAKKENCVPNRCA